MPKNIDGYRKEAEKTPEDVRLSSQWSRLNVVIILVVFAFSVSVAVDTVDGIRLIRPALTEESKICMVEFAQKKCDVLSMTSQCQQIMDCIQLKDHPIIWSKIKTYTSIIYDEVIEDLPVPTVVIAIILLWQLRDSLEMNRRATT